MGKCDIAGGILGFGLNKFAESQGLKPLPAGAGLAFELNPGFIIKQEVKGLCKPGTEPLLRLDLKKLPQFAQAYLIDRMESIASEQQDKALEDSRQAVRNAHGAAGGHRPARDGYGRVLVRPGQEGRGQGERRPAEAHVHVQVDGERSGARSVAAAGIGEVDPDPGRWTGAGGAAASYSEAPRGTASPASEHFCRIG